MIPPSSEGGIRPERREEGGEAQGGRDPPLKRGRHPAQSQPGVKAPGPGPSDGGDEVPAAVRPDAPPTLG